MKWPDDYVAELRRLYHLEMSVRRIGIELGRTKGAVISKLHSLGLKRGHAFRPKVTANAPRATRSDKGTRRVSVKRLSPRGNGHLRATVIEETVDLPVERIEDQAIPVAQRRTLFELTDKTCRWPVGTPGEPDFFFCGAEPAKGAVYCGPHCAVAYNGPPVRSRAPWVASRGERA